MKNPISTLFILLFGLLAFSANAQTQEVTIKVGFDCDHYQECETGQSRLEKHLMYTKGIKAIKWDPKTTSVVLQYNAGKTTVEQIREAISKAGYDADEVKADPKAYTKLDACCQKKG